MADVEIPKLIEHLFDKKRLSIIRLFIASKDAELSLTEISKRAEVPPASAFRIIHEFTTLGLLAVKQIKHLKLYRLNDNNAAKFLEQFLREEKHILDVAVNQLSVVPNIDMIVSHGKITKDLANIVIIGNDIDIMQIKPIIAKLKEEYKFTVSELVVTNAQFEQMTAMGLYSGERKILFKKTG